MFKHTKLHYTKIRYKKSGMKNSNFYPMIGGMCVFIILTDNRPIIGTVMSLIELDIINELKAHTEQNIIMITQ